MNHLSADDAICWYAIRTHPKQEIRAADNLRAWDVQTFYPTVRGHHLNESSGKIDYIVKPLFPSYLFARFEPSRLLHKIRFTRGIHSVVCVGTKPAPVDDRIIEIISAQIDETGYVNVAKELEKGTKVLIQAGPFKGFTGVFERKASAADRVRLLLDCVCYQAQIEIESKMVMKV
ncbi:MAG TPA: transcription termination/antitermination NusG family protein [Blastocatellia bacterium]|nr:transcription termination/antitermination NusG family protein [Blastocatellia bacterium]